MCVGRGFLAGIEGRDEEPVRKSFCQIPEGAGVTSCVTQNLTMKKHHGERISQQTNHRQQYQRITLVDGGVLEVAIAGEGLKQFRVDAPATAAHLMNKRGGDGAELEIRGVEVGALDGNLYFLFLL